jgi:BirA family transcriptional regulator, biotin operon repressor / biotin---[acetyl-CoA-carboxylase] ligase
MNERNIRKAISDLPLGGYRFYKQIGSTNDTALAWAADGAPDMSLVYAEEQTSGRGRGDRRWFTPPGAGLAFSLVLRPFSGEELSVPLFSGLGALAVCDALGKRGLHPEIKWPNDILLNRQKICGILAESVWIGEKVDSIVLGIGVNIKPESVPPAEGLNYPATSLEDVVGRRVSRQNLLRDILLALLTWRGLLTKPAFLQTWEKNLAFRGDQVEIQAEGVEPETGKLEGLEADGHLRLRSLNGQTFTVQFGEVHLRRVV